MRVIFINRFFHPDLSATSTILSDLAFGLAARGRSVHVITSRLRYEAAHEAAHGPPAVAPPDLAVREIVAGVVVHRVPTTRFGRGRLLGRAVDYLTFYPAAAWRLWRLARVGDIVIAKTDPPMVSVAVAPVCRLRRARLVNWLQDLFPEVAQAAGIGARWRVVYAFLARIRTASLRAAVANVVIGGGMAERVAALGVSRDRIRIIPNWADPAALRPIPHADNPFRRAAGLDGAFVVAYAGNLGRVHDVATLLDAMTILARPDRRRDGSPPVHWLFMGGGSLTRTLKVEVARRRLNAVSFLPYQPAATLANSLSAADAHVVTLRPEFEGLVVPSKAGGAAAVGRPLLFVGDPGGEIGRWLARHGCGYAIRSGDGEGLARAITALAEDPAGRDAMGRRARRAFEAEFDRAVALSRWDGLLDEVAPSDRLPPEPTAGTGSVGRGPAGPGAQGPAGDPR